MGALTEAIGHRGRIGVELGQEQRMGMPVGPTWSWWVRCPRQSS